MAVLLFFTIREGLNIISILLFMIAALTDILDGTLARHFHVESKLGEHLDAIADGWLVAWVWLGFAIAGTISLWIWFTGFGYMIITYALEITIVKHVPEWGAKIIYIRPFTYAALMLLTPVLLALRTENLATKATVFCAICAFLLICLLSKKVRVRYFISLLLSGKALGEQ